MKKAIGGSMFLAVGALAGIASAMIGIDQAGTMSLAPGSPWQSWELSPASRAHPYVLAHYLMAGRLPPASGQMREFAAQRSDDGGVLTPVCTYLLVAKPAPGQWWSMATTSAGATDTGSNGVITADTAIAETDGIVRLAVSRQPSGGNWVRAPATGAFTLLYTLADASPGDAHPEIPAFSIDRSGC